MHGDDFGRSRGITDSISECLDTGSLNSVSIPANGHGYEYAVNSFIKRGGLRLSIHLDLVEWKSISNPRDIPLLVNNEGLFYQSFAKLWLRYLIGSKNIKRSLHDQVKTELDAQISKVKKSFANDKEFEVNIDSHQHIHMIPFVFEALVELTEKHQVKYVRLGNEPFFLCLKGKGWFQNYFGSNLIKHFLLKTLSCRYKKILTKKGIGYPDYFIGLLFTGSMSVKAAECALAQIRNRRGDITTEILFHACKAQKGEEEFWSNNPFLLNYYFSDKRDYEKNALRDPVLKDIIEKFKE